MGVLVRRGGVDQEISGSARAGGGGVIPWTWPVNCSLGAIVDSACIRVSIASVIVFLTVRRWVWVWVIIAPIGGPWILGRCQEADVRGNVGEGLMYIGYAGPNDWQLVHQT